MLKNHYIYKMQKIKNKMPEKIIEKLYSKEINLKHIASTEKGFKSYSEYQKSLVMEKGFKSYLEYQESLVKKKGFKSLNEYYKSLAKKRGFKSLKEYDKSLVEKRGFKSYSEYQKSLVMEKQKNPKNRKLSDLIRKRLNKLNKPPKWLSMELGISDNSVRKYIHKINIPKKELLEKLFQKLEVPYKTLDDLMENTI